ncbi:MAG: hypothetical protein HGA19_23265 [Oscillochloris sp.]|nr:hypothetical protein [Oscillochloris sp.]
MSDQAPHPRYPRPTIIEALCEIYSGSDSALKMIDSSLLLGLIETLAPSLLKEILTTLHEAGLVAGISDEPDLANQEAVGVDVLGAYTRAQDREGFAAAISRILWKHQPVDAITGAIDLALSLDLPKQAAAVARAGLTRFPDDPRFRQAARVLEPPVVRSTPAPHAGGLSASQGWLRDHAAPYRGQWVVVREGQLLGAAPDLGSLRTLIERENDPATTIITRVW